MHSDPRERWFRSRLLVTLQGWSHEGLIDADTLAVLVARVAEDAAPAPRTLPVVAVVEPEPEVEPEPVVEAPKPYELPSPPMAGRGGWSAVGGFLRERTGWVLGVALTVVGSLYVAGTVWGALSAAWRQVLVVGFLGLYAFGFRKVAERVGRVEGGRPARRWLELVVVALGPAQAMAAGALASLGAGPALVGLAAVAALQGWLLRGLVSRRFLVAWIPLAMSVGLVPLIGGAALTIAAALGAVATLIVATGERGPHEAGPAVLCGGVVAFHLLLGEPGVAVLAPVLALAGLAALYLDVARAHWRGLHRVRPEALPGVLALGLGLAGALCTLPGFTPLPTGATSAVTWGVLVLLFGGAALAWRRAVLVHFALAAALFAVLCAPDLFRAVIAPLTEQARHALGYTSSPLPLAWYSLTLLPFVIGCRLVEELPARAGWKQADELAAATHRFTLGLSAALLVLAHTRPGDLRPALVALPIYAVIAFREKRLRDALGGALVPGLLGLWCVDAVLQGLVEPTWGVVLGAAAFAALPHAFRLVCERIGSEAPVRGAELVSLVGAVALPVLPLVSATDFWSTLDALLVSALGLALGGAVVLLRDLDGAERRFLPELGLGMVVLGSSRVLLRPEDELAFWFVAFAAAAVVLELAWSRWRRALTVAAHVWAGLAVVAGTLVLDDPWRGLVKLPVALMLVRWAWLLRDRRMGDVYGVLLALGVGEAAGRRVFESDGVAWGATAAVLGAWLPGAFLFRKDALRERIGWPAAFVGAAAAVLAVAIHGYEGTALTVAALPLVLVPLLVPLEVGVEVFGACLALGLGAVALPTSWGLLLAGVGWAGWAAWRGDDLRVGVAGLGSVLMLGAGLALDPVWDGLGLVAGGAAALLALAARDRRFSEAGWAAAVAVPVFVGARLGIEVGLLGGTALLVAMAAVAPRVATTSLGSGVPPVVQLLLPVAVIGWTVRLSVAPGEGHLATVVPVVLLMLLAHRGGMTSVRFLAAPVAAAILLRVGAPDEAWPLVTVALTAGALLSPSSERWWDDGRSWAGVGLLATGVALVAVPLPLVLALPVWLVAAAVAWRLGSWWLLLPLLPAAGPGLEEPETTWQLALLAGTAWLLGARRIGLLGAFVAAEALTIEIFDLELGLPVLVALGAFGAALTLDDWSRRVGRVALVLMIVACCADAEAAPLLVLVSLVGAGALEAWRGGWWWALGWAGSAYALARIAGPLEGLAPGAELALLLGASLALEALRRQLPADEPALRHAAIWLPAVGLGLVLYGGGGPWALAAVGCWHGVRFVARSRTRDLVTAAVLLDVACVWTAMRLGIEEPLAFVGPVALSLGVVAQLLRGSVDRVVVDTLRVVAAAALYLTAFGTSLEDPVRSLHLLLLALAGVGLGAFLRVRAYLLAGFGAATAAVLTNLIRFGLEHSQFWAFYLTALGLSILGLMVGLTVHRQRFDTWMGQVRSTLSDWE